MSFWRARHDDLRRRWGARCNQPGHPMRATVTVEIVGRTSLGRSAPRTFAVAIDLLHGQMSEAHLMRQVQAAVEATYLSDAHMSGRLSVEAAMAKRSADADAMHRAWLTKRSELTFTADRPQGRR